MQKKTLLLINHSQILMDLTKKILERAGYSVRCAAGVAGAREYLMDFTPDGVVLENDLPDGKGFDYCRELCEKIAVPIMFLSNVKEDELPAFRAGAYDFLKKPYDNDIMTARIGIMLNAKTSVIPTADSEKDSDAFENTNLTVQQPKLTVEAIKKKPIPKIRNLYMTVAACFVLMFGGLGIFNLLKNLFPYDEIFDGQPPLVGMPFQTDENAKPYTGTEQSIQFPRIDDITVPADSKNVDILLFNPTDNPCYFVFEIILTDTRESLYSSGIVEPGMCIDEISLSRELMKGEHDAYIKIYSYALEDFAAMNSVAIEFYLTAE